MLYKQHCVGGFASMGSDPEDYLFSQGWDHKQTSLRGNSVVAVPPLPSSYINLLLLHKKENKLKLWFYVVVCAPLLLKRNNNK